VTCVQCLQSDANGTALFNDLPEGVYQIETTAQQHSGASAIVTVVGATSAQLLLSLQPVQVPFLRSLADAQASSCIGVGCELPSKHCATADLARATLCCCDA